MFALTNLGVLFLAIYLIVIGIMTLIAGVSIPPIIPGILALVAGILLLLRR